MLLEEVFDELDHHAVFVDRHADDGEAHRPEQVQGEVVGGLFDEHGVASFEQHLTGQRDRLLRPGRDQHLVGRRCGFPGWRAVARRSRAAARTRGRTGRTPMRPVPSRPRTSLIVLANSLTGNIRGSPTPVNAIRSGCGGREGSVSRGGRSAALPLPQGPALAIGLSVPVMAPTPERQQRCHCPRGRRSARRGPTPRRRWRR